MQVKKFIWTPPSSPHNKRIVVRLWVLEKNVLLTRHRQEPRPYRDPLFHARLKKTPMTYKTTKSNLESKITFKHLQMLNKNCSTHLLRHVLRKYVPNRVISFAWHLEFNTTLELKPCLGSFPIVTDWHYNLKPHISARLTCRCRPFCLAPLSQSLHSTRWPILLLYIHPHHYLR